MLKWFKRERASVAPRTPKTAGRREFFRLAGAGAVAGGAAVLGGTERAEAALPDDAAGYRETDHVRRYYDSARM